MRFSAFVFSLLAAPALADCPTAADLTNGVRVTETDGSINLFRLISDGVVQNDGAAPSGYTYRNILIHGVHLAELGDTEGGAYINGGPRTVTFDVTAAGLPIPQPLTKATYETVITNSGNDYPETQDQTWGAISTLTIGECTYDMIPGKITYTNSSYVVFEGLHYLPEMQLALLHSYQIEGQAADRYIAAKIEAVE